MFARRIMSRPQYNRYTESSSVGQGPVVNGGLIDFQDNLNRGVCEYLSPNQIVLQQQQQTPHAYPQQQQQQAFYPSHNPIMGYQQQAYPMTQPAVLSSPATCFNGPPSFIHAHGVTYRPSEAMIEAPGPQAETRQPASLHCDTDHDMEEDLEHKVNQRVAHVSKAYVSSKSVTKKTPGAAAEPRANYSKGDHPRTARSHRHNPDNRARNAGGEAPVQAPVFHKATRSTKDIETRRPRSDVESAAQSVKRANASMPIISRFPLRY